MRVCCAMLIPIAVLIVLLLLNGVFAMSELALMTSRQSRLTGRAKSGDKGAAAALRLAEEPTRFLSTVQIGITLIGILAGAYGEKAISSRLEARLADTGWLPAGMAGPVSLVTVVLLITYFSLVLGELVPKRVALSHPEAVSSFIARPLSALSWVAAGPAWVLTVSTEAVLRAARIRRDPASEVSEEDLRALMSRAASVGVLTPQEHRLVQRTLQVNDMTASDLMTPRQEIPWLNAESGPDAARSLLTDLRHDFVAVCRGSLDSLVGVVSARALAAWVLSGRGGEVGPVAQKPLFVPETCPALVLLDRFREADTRVAFVVDEYGGTSGVLSITDVVRAIVGDLSRAERRTRPGARRRRDGSWLVDGRMPVGEMVQALGITDDGQEQPPDAKTCAGVVLALLGHIPEPAESVRWRGWVFEVVDMDGTRVDKVLARPIGPETP